MTITGQAVGQAEDGAHGSEIPDGKHVTAWNLDAIGRSYDEAKANIADLGAPAAQDGTDGSPDTEAIDGDAIKPPAGSRTPSAGPASTTSPREPEVAPGALAPEPTPVPGRSWRTWRRWFSVRTEPDA